MTDVTARRVLPTVTAWTGRRSLPTAAIIAGATLGYLSGNILPLLVPSYASRFHLSSAAIGIVAAVQLLSLAASSLTLASIGTRCDRVRVAQGGLVFAAAGYLCTGLAMNSGTLLFANLLTGLGLGAVFATSTAAIAATADHDRTASVAVVGSTLVIAFLMLTVPFVESTAGPMPAYGVLVALCIAAIPVMRFLPEHTRVLGTREATTAWHGSTRPSFWFVGGVVLLAVVDQGAWSYADIIAVDHHVLSEAAATVTLSIAALTALAGVPAATFLARRRSRAAAVIAALLAETVTKSLLPVADTPWLFIPSALLWQMAYLGVLVLMLAVAADRDRSGRWVATAGGALAIGTGVGPAVAGWVLQHLGAAGLSAFLAVATLIAAVPVAFVAVNTVTEK